MASVSGGQFHFSSGNEQVSSSSQGAGSDHLNLASIAGQAGGSGLTSVTSAEHSGGGIPAGTGHDVVTSNGGDGGAVVHFDDGSSLTILGSHGTDFGFSH